MAKITFIEKNGTPHAMEVADGTTLMQAAVSHQVPGIDADCGGQLTCGTCLISVPATWLDKLGTSSKLERQIVALRESDCDNGRLSCQIVAGPELDGLCVIVPGR